MKRFICTILALFFTLTFAGPAIGIYMPPSRVKPTQADIMVATNFFRDLKWDVSQASKGVIKLTLPKVDNKYIIVIGQATINDKKVPVDGKGLYQGSGGLVVTTNISTVNKTWFHFHFANDSTSAILAAELYSYIPGDTSIRYIPVQERVYPIVGPDGNISGWTNEDDVRVNEDGSLIDQPSTPPAPKSYFSDVNTKYWALNVINSLYEAGYIKGYPNGTFKPDNNITRAEFMVMLGNVLKDKWTNASLYNHSGETDIISSSHWSYNAVNGTFKYMASGDIQRIFADEFDPDKTITREEVVAVLAAILCVHPNYQTKAAASLIFEDTVTSHFPESIKFASENNLVSGYPDGTFKPLNNITRAEIAAVITNLFSNL